MKLKEDTGGITENLIIYFTEVGTRLGVGEDTLNIIKMIFKDKNPKLRLAYLFAEHEDNQVSSFQAAELMKQKGLADKFLICGYPAVPGYPGGPVWQKHLAQKVGSDNVGLVPFPYPLLNTKTESMALISYLRRINHMEIYIVAPHFHLPRVFMALASEAIKNYVSLKIYNYPGIHLPWERLVYHSQGILQNTRTGLVEDELKKIMTYQGQRDILPSAQILNYLYRRK